MPWMEKPLVSGIYRELFLEHSARDTKLLAEGAHQESGAIERTQRPRELGIK